MTQAHAPLIAVDVGNSRVKLGRFDEVQSAPGRLPNPSAALDLGPEPAQFAGISAWLGDRAADDFRWYIGSVQRAVSSTLIDWLRAQGAGQITLLASFDLPLRATLPRPDMVGIDRLLGAVAVNHIREPGSPAIVVDLGTAITVDLVAADGGFAGGAILPGIGLSSRALHEFTDLLPQLDMQALAEPPAALGTDTIAAMRAGIYWGAVGGVRQLIELLGRQLAGPPQIFLTGGAAPAVAHLIAAEAQYQAHLVLSGIALAAAGTRS
ncbi:MAG TPA: type III pantothenate kinase [Pirellulales bacterium]|jgi:type III pantothenate kinase|nr:type III pantothenate kinase [Pirellulales bacterium]